MKLKGKKNCILIRSDGSNKIILLLAGIIFLFVRSRNIANHRPGNYNIHHYEENYHSRRRRNADPHQGLQEKKYCLNIEEREHGRKKKMKDDTDDIQEVKATVVTRLANAVPYASSHNWT